MQSTYTINSIFLIRIGLGTNASREECFIMRPKEQKLNVLFQCWSASENILTTFSRCRSFGSFSAVK